MAESADQQGGKSSGEQGAAVQEATPPESGASRATTAPAEASRASEAADGPTAGLDLVLDVPLRMTVEIGGTRLFVREVLQLDKGSVIELDRMSGEPADVLVNGRLVGRGEVTVVEDRLAVRLVEVVGMERPSRPRR